MFRRTAHIYDRVYEAEGKDYAAEASDVRDQIERRNRSARSLLDVACGTGGHLRHFADWFDVVGLDVDPSMLAVAQENAPGVSLVEADMRSFQLGRSFDAVVCLFSSVGYMSCADELDHAITRMATHLAAEGVLIVDGWVRPDAWIERGSVHAVATNRDGMAVARVTKSRREGARTSLEMHHLVASADGIEHLVDRHELTLFTPDEYERAFERAGLTPECVESPMPGRDRYIAMKDR